jgi:uncharacterized protein (TIGR03437 family)
MRKLEILFIVGLVLCPDGSWAQQSSASAGAVVGVAYTVPNTAFQVAPGQVVSLMVYGLEYRVIQPIEAVGTPLPKSLAGFSVDFQQFQTTIPVPILGIQQTACFSVSIGPCSALTNIVVQVPYEIKPFCLVCGILEGARYFLVSDMGQEKATVAVAVPGDNIHIISSRDSTSQPFQSSTQPLLEKAILHGDNTFVDSNHPATAGEELVMYVFGLGLTDPSVKTGQASPASAVRFDPNSALTRSGIGLFFDFRPNAPPSRPSPYVAPVLVAANYIGLVPGLVGLYQANFTVPPVPAAAPSCSADNLYANLTVNLVGAWSFDGGGICVKRAGS